MVRSKAASGGQAAVGGARPAAGHQRPVAGRAALAAFLAAHAIAGPAALAQSSGPAAATAQEYLLAARAAVVGGRLATARDDLERAETRLLDRPVGPLQAVTPDRDRAVLDIAVARRAVGAGQRQVAVRAIDDAIRQVSLPPVPVAAGGASILPSAPLLFPPAAAATPVAPAVPYETYALLPGR